MTDVAIIGAGLHPFGRFEGKSAMEMAADAIQSRARRCRCGVERHPIRGRRQLDGGQPGRDCRHGGSHRDPVHRCVQRLRDSGQRHQVVRRQYPVGRLRHRHRGRDGQAPARRLHRRPRAGRDAELVRRERSIPHHPVLRDEGQPLPARPRHLDRHAGQGGREELSQRRVEPQRVSPQADLRRSHPGLADAELPADPVHVLCSRRGCRRSRDVPRRYRAPVHHQTGVCPRGRSPHPPIRRLRGEHDVRPRRGGRVADRLRRESRLRERRVWRRRTSTSSSCRTPTPARK